MMKIEKFETNRLRHVLDLAKKFGDLPIKDFINEINRMLPKESGFSLDIFLNELLDLLRLELQKSEFDDDDRLNLWFILSGTFLIHYDSDVKRLYEKFLASELDKIMSKDFRV